MINITANIHFQRCIFGLSSVSRRHAIVNMGGRRGFYARWQTGKRFWYNQGSESKQERRDMTLKKLIFWFWSTLAVAAAATAILGLLFFAATGKNMLGPVGKQLLLGLTLGAAAELGFFSYLVFNWLSRGLIRNKAFYDVLLILLLLLVLGNLTYLQVAKFKGMDLGLHLLIPAVILAAGVAVALLKAKWTQPEAFLPALFFMVVATVMEAIPSLNPQAGEIPLPMILHTILVLLAANAWQLLQLHRWVTPAANKKSQTRNGKGRA
jgi:KinB signaling pathway activation protein